MTDMTRIGILVEDRALIRSLRGKKTNERVGLYRSIALEEGLDIIVFSIHGLQVRRRRVIGYVPTEKGWKKTTKPIPRVIHKRVLFRDTTALNKLKALQRRGIILVNPHRMQNKVTMNTLLSKDPVVKTHLPWTCSYRWSVIERELDAGHSVLLKPQIGSVGRGIIRLVPLSDRRVQLTGGFTLTIPMRKLAKTLRSKIRPNRYLIQQYITLARYNGKLFDLRVPVQRDGLGAWKVPDIVAKVAGKHPFLTNIAQGGRALPGEIVMKKAFPPPKAEEAIAAVERLAIAVAQAVSKTYRYAADLGLDIGVDTAGKPWLIEVNTRDQRITFFEAGLHRAFRTIYRNPLAYCAHLMTSSRGR